MDPVRYLIMPSPHFSGSSNKGAQGLNSLLIASPQRTLMTACIAQPALLLGNPTKEGAAYLFNESVQAWTTQYPFKQLVLFNPF
jgi:hypothetical protein